MSSVGASYAHINELRKSCEEKMDKKKGEASDLVTEEKGFKGKVHPSGNSSLVSGEEQELGHAYVMRKLHKEKMKRMDEEMGITKESKEKKANKVFFGIRRKVHPKVLVSQKSHDMSKESEERGHDL
ncbi:hypothetical protein Cni_G22697 [Canna indica]|uniref:Uncharacterized protein n=1 Tax=Canna indica TaxID=4628 RepID=A0AAQ3KRQ8_9LILI|nr:hypothetical protein Cni_G22697 [Canna indica]